LILDAELYPVVSFFAIDKHTGNEGINIRSRFSLLQELQAVLIPDSIFSQIEAKEFKEWLQL
jgi:hypothetical protein